MFGQRTIAKSFHTHDCSEEHFNRLSFVHSHSFSNQIDEKFYEINLLEINIDLVHWNGTAVFTVDWIISGVVLSKITIITSLYSNKLQTHIKSKAVCQFRLFLSEYGHKWKIITHIIVKFYFYFISFQCLQIQKKNMQIFLKYGMVLYRRHTDTVKGSCSIFFNTSHNNINTSTRILRCWAGGKAASYMCWPHSFYLVQASESLHIFMTSFSVFSFSFEWSAPTFTHCAFYGFCCVCVSQHVWATERLNIS